MADFRALCAELVDDLELCDWPYKLKETIRADIDRARTALAAAPESAVKQSLTTAPPAPLEGEVGELVAWLRMQGEAQKPGPNSLLCDKTKKELHANGTKLVCAADLLQRLSPPQPVPLRSYAQTGRYNGDSTVQGSRG